MSNILSIVGVEPKLSSNTNRKKIVLANFYNVEISLAHLCNVVITIIVITLTVLLEYGTIPAVKQGFYCGDPSISHKYQGDTITPEILGATAVLLPLIIIIVIELLACESYRKINPYTVIFYMQECAMGVSLTLLLTSIAKVIVGEHRPHFLDVCRPDKNINCTFGDFIDNYECTSTEFDGIFLVDASLSFPSGHSSISWCIAIFLCYIINTKTATINAGYLIKPLLISVVLTWSILCSLSRITDRRHHWWDVLTGSIFGICMGIYTINVVIEKINKRFENDKERDKPQCSIIV